MKCYKCNCPDTKYRCIKCGNSICNICSISCSDDTPGYSEENYCIGKCKECIGQKRAAVEDIGSPTQPKQSSLASFFKPTVKSSSSKLASVNVKSQKE